MNPDEKLEAYNAGVKAGIKHTESSPETKRFMAKIETEMIHLKEELSKQSAKIDKLPTKADMELSNEKLIQRVFDSTDIKYAPKSIERVVYGTVWAITLFIIYSLIKIL